MNSFTKPVVGVDTAQNVFQLYAWAPDHAEQQPNRKLPPEAAYRYVALPESLLAALSVAKHLSDWHSASMTQHVPAKFIDDGHLARHVRRGH